MACACKVTRQLDFLHKKYGDKLPERRKTDIIGKVRAKTTNLFLYAFAIPLLPFIALKTKKKGRRGIYNIDKIFNFSKQRNG